MFLYNLKSAFRYFSKQKIFISINLVGLVISFAVSSLIMLYVINELSYDLEHKNAKQIYRVLNSQELSKNTDALTTLDLGPLIKESMPEVEKMSRMVRQKSHVIVGEDEVLMASAFVDPEFLEMFTIKGNQKIDASFLFGPNTVLITEKTAKTIFGETYPVGKDLKVKFPQGEYNFTITGVVENFSRFSSVKADALFNFDFYQKNLCDPFFEAYPFFTTFLMISNDGDIPFLEKKIHTENIDVWTGIPKKYKLQKYSRMYLHSSHLANNFFPTGNSRILYGLVFIVILIIVMACLNFGILSTACGLTRDKEIGVRKITGASIKQVKRLVVFESFLLVLIATPLAILTARLLLPWFNNFFNRELTFSFINNLPFTLSMFGLVLLTATIAGLVTSATTARMTPVALLKKQNTKLKRGINLNKILLTSQMATIIWFLTVALLIFKQINFAQSKGLGYNPDNLLIFTVNNPDFHFDMNNLKYEDYNKLENFLSRIKESQAVVDASVVHKTPPKNDTFSTGFIKVKRTNQEIRVPGIYGLANFSEFIGYRLKEGMYLSDNYSGNAENEILINEAAAEYLGLENPVGEEIAMDGVESARIVGVVYDFNFQSMRKEIVPLRIKKTNKYYSPFDIVVRYQPNMEKESIADFNTLFSKMYKGYENEYTFHKDKIEALYEKELNEAHVFSLGIILAIFISVMGIFGISLFTIRQRVKEIGIRKINGARTNRILSFLNLGITKWVGLAFVISIPASWFSMQKWLENFAYKTQISWWIFALAGAIALFIALFTVSWQSWRAASRNPVEALRYE